MAKEYSGKDVEEALTNASVDMGVTSDQLTYEVVEKGSSGFLGLSKKNAVILVSLKSEVEKEAPAAEKKEEVKKEVKAEAPAAKAEVKKAATVAGDPTETALKFLNEVFEAMKLEVTIDSKFNEEEGVLDLDLKGPEMGVIIGKRGQTLDSLQYLTNLAVNRKTDGYTKVKIDTEDYRRRRKETLENLARNCAYKVKKTHRPMSLEAMNPYERRIIHSALQDDEYVTTHSEGEEPYRHVVVTLK